MAYSGRALVVDDEPNVRKVLRRACTKIDLDVHEAERGDEGLRLLEGGSYNLLLSDYMMPGMDGLQLVSRARVMSPELPIVMITGYATVDRVVDAMQAGADHVLEKPVDMTMLRDTMQSVMARHVSEPDDPVTDPAITQNPLGNRFISAFRGRMRELASLMDRVARTDCTVLIRGESGTGKELVARAIHERSRRKDGAFIPVNCGAIPESLLESELFGHARGAFSGAYRDRPGRFALAHGGTILLDEVGEMSPAFQVKLLRVLQEHSFEPVGGTRPVASDFRVIAATHRDLGEMVREGSFREDLYYRLNVMEMELPALRERPEDLEPLLEHFIRQFNQRHGLEVELCVPELMATLKRYEWPGNVRELENLVERACILKGDGPLDGQDIPPHVHGQRAPTRGNGSGCSLPEDGIDFYGAVEEFENSLIMQALERTNGNKNKAAAVLSLNRTTLVEKLKKKGMM